MMPKSFRNKEIADLLRSIAAAYIVKNEDRFRIMAYEKAAASIEHASSEVKDLWDEEKLGDLAGVGPNIASHLDELFRTGHVKHFDEVAKDLPPAMFGFLLLPGIGPKTAFILCKALGIERSNGALEKLEKAARSKKIREIEGFGKKSESDILEAISAYKKGQVKEDRMLLPYADTMADDIIKYLIKCPCVIRADVLGSLRRKVSTIGDIDISVETKDPKEAIEWFTKYPKIKRILGRGEESLVRVILINGRQIDLRIQIPEAYGAMLQYFTGGKAHNIALREWAQKHNKSLSEYGIKTDGQLKKYRSEEEFYKDLGMDWIPPELREDTGEIQAALRSAKDKLGGLPKLVELKDIRGDLHVHSNFPIETSHDQGVNSISEILGNAGKRGYDYVAFTEHNPSVSKHTSTQVVEILKRKRALIDKYNYSNENSYEKRTHNIPVYAINSLEIDIKPDGYLGIPEKGLELLDFAMVSVHSSFDLTKDKMTKRILRALEHPKVKILGHPTGRKLNYREGYEVEWNTIFEFCAKHHKWLEINSWPDRLDLPDNLVREAIKRGVKMVICTDTHEISHLNLIEYGVAVARRGWATKSDIINTLGLEEFLKEVNERR